MSVVVYSSKMAVNKLLHFQKYVANKDYTHEVINTLEEPIIARIIRIHPVAWYSHISMRFELYGCYSGELDEDMHLLEYIFVVNVKFFSHSCIYCVMKYAGWIQLFVVYFLTAYQNGILSYLQDTLDGRNCRQVNGKENCVLVQSNLLQNYVC